MRTTVLLRFNVGPERDALCIAVITHVRSLYVNALEELFALIAVFFPFPSAIEKRRITV